MKLERLVGNELVDEQFVVISNAVANEGDEVAVVDAADNLHLGLELALALPAAALEALHGHLSPIGQDALVDEAEAALAQEVELREAVGGRSQLLVTELVHASSHVLRLDHTMLP